MSESVESGGDGEIGVVKYGSGLASKRWVGDPYSTWVCRCGFLDEGASAERGFDVTVFLRKEGII